MTTAQTMLWINVVSDRPAGEPGRKFWSIDFDSEADALEDSKDYPRIGRLGGEIHYVETIEHRIGTGIDFPEMEAANRNVLRAWLSKAPAA